MTDEVKAAFERLGKHEHYMGIPVGADIALIRREFETLEWIAEQAIDTHCPPPKVAISCDDMAVCRTCWLDAARKAVEEGE